MKPQKPTREELLSLLRQAENALSNTREHNPWDLGPSSLLQAIRYMLGAEEGGQSGGTP